jgi:hypothetical protein
MLLISLIIDYLELYDKDEECNSLVAFSKLLRHV